LNSLKEAKSSSYEEVISFTKHNPSDHSYKNFKSHSNEIISESEYANIYWTCIYTNEIKEGPKAPPKKAQTEIINYLEQRVSQLEKNKNRKEREEQRREFETGSTRGSSPNEDKTGFYNKYKVKDSIPDDLKSSFEEDDDIEISNDNQTAKDIFNDMNAYVCSIMQKRSTKPHLIINGAPGVGKCLSPETKIKIKIEDIIAEEFEAYLKSL
jgi:hypothetical protein